MSFQVKVQPEGDTFEVRKDEIVLTAALRQGVGLPYGCKDGACGSCKCKLVSGEVRHDPYQEKALSPAEAERGIILTCRATAQSDLVIEARTVAAGDTPPRKMPVRVFSLDRPVGDVAILKLQLPAADPFVFKAGQYIEFILRDGTRRSYSMANAPEHVAQVLGNDAPGLELHIRHMPGGLFTDQVFSSLKAKDILRVEGPFGTFFLRSGEKPIVFLASGTGMAPIKAMVEHMAAAGVSRKTVLYWGCRQVEDLYLHQWALDAAKRLPWLTYVPVLSDANPEDGWSGRTGFVHQAVMADLPNLSGYEVYACGAPIMVHSARTDFTQHCALPDDAFFADAFTSAADAA